MTVETFVTVASEADCVMVEGTVTVVADLAHEEAEPKFEGVRVMVGPAVQVALDAGRVVVTVMGDPDWVWVMVKVDSLAEMLLVIVAVTLMVVVEAVAVTVLEMKLEMYTVDVEADAVTV